MKGIRIALLAGSFVLSAAAVADTTTGIPSNGTSAQPVGALMVERSVYVPVNDQGKANPDEMLVVERKVFVPADELQSPSQAATSSGSTGQAAATATAPAAVFVLVPDAGTTSSAQGERHYRMRKLDQVASNGQRCNDLKDNSSECTSHAGTGAAATASTQGQSGR